MLKSQWTTVYFPTIRNEHFSDTSNNSADSKSKPAGSTDKKVNVESRKEERNQTSEMVGYKEYQALN